MMTNKNKSILKHCIILAFLYCISSCEASQEELEIDEPIIEVKQTKSAKKGVSFKYNTVDDINVLAQGISWSYNWGLTQSDLFMQEMNASGLDYYPMAWNDINEEILRTHVSKNPNCKYLLAYNEPNLIDQANMTPAEAASKWPQLKAVADDLNLKIVSPAMNYGTLPNYSDPIVWLDEFFTLVPLSDIDAIAVHSYMANIGALKSYIHSYKKYGKPIWLTEFCAWDGLNENNFTAEKQAQYMCDAINYLELDADVEKYAWFIPRGDGPEDRFPYMFLLKSSPPSQLTSLGAIFTQISTQDKDTYYPLNQQIEAEHYSAIAVAGVNNKINGPRVRLCSDAPNESLELYSFLPDQWIEYQIDIQGGGDYVLEFRYASIADPTIEINIDGLDPILIELTKTGAEYIWNTSQSPIHLHPGKHTLYFSVKKGILSLNWFKVRSV